MASKIITKYLNSRLAFSKCVIINDLFNCWKRKKNVSI